MIDGKIDTAQLAQSVRKWSRDFGDTNEETLARIGAEACRNLAHRCQPWGVNAKSRRTLEKAVFLDAAKVLVPVMDAAIWAQILAGDVRALPDKAGNWQRFNPGNVLRDKTQINAFVERKRNGGRIKGNVPFAQRGICWHADAKAVMRERTKRAGIAKGGFLMAGLEITRIAGKKGLGIGARFGAWAVAAARAHGVNGSAVFLRSFFNPKITINNPARHSRSFRVLRQRDAKGAIEAGFKRSLSFYKRALQKMDRKTHK